MDELIDELMTDEPKRKRVTILPSLIFAIILIASGITLTSLIVNNLWLVPLDHPEFLRLQREAMAGVATATDLVGAADLTLLTLFLLGIILITTGATLPIMFLINQRGDSQRNVYGRPFHILLRQAFWIGLWVAVCLWLHMHRTFGVAIGTLIAFLFLLMEGLLLVRGRSRTNDDVPIT